MFTGMVTITQNDASPELLANARRGPCATPTEPEMVEYLFTHHRAHHEKKPNITKDAVAATLSYQMRTHAMKSSFLQQGHRTPLGHCTDYWDRTEAQRRHSLHGHIPYWTKRRKLNAPVERARAESRQRGDRDKPFEDGGTEDHVYQTQHCLLYTSPSPRD